MTRPVSGPGRCVTHRTVRSMTAQHFNFLLLYAHEPQPKTNTQAGKTVRLFIHSSPVPSPSPL